MEQNLVSDEELLERLNIVLHGSKQERSKEIAENRQEDNFVEKFHEVNETTEGNARSSLGHSKSFGSQKNLALENQYLSLQLQAEKKKAKELQSKFKLFENSVKYFERLNGQLETIKKAVDEDFVDIEKKEFGGIGTGNIDTMQKLRPKTIHTAASGAVTVNQAQDEIGSGAANQIDTPPAEQGNKVKIKEELKEEVAFRDAEDFRQLEQNLEIVNNTEYDAEKVFITKTEKRCLEDIGNLASRTRAPLDDKHQRYFEKDRRKFANSIMMPEIQEVNKNETVPPEILSKTKETPVNLTSTELDGLRSYLLQLKELIARRETAWARTTERDYNQRVEITRFKNEVSHLRMLCEKRQRDIKERDQVIANKDDEIKELQKRIQGLRSAILKLEKKDERIMDTLEGTTNEVLENSQIVQKSYNAMKRQSSMNRSNTSSTANILSVKQAGLTQSKPLSTSRDLLRKSKYTPEKSSSSRKIKIYEEQKSSANEDDSKSIGDKGSKKIVSKEKPKTRQKNDVLVNKTKEAYEKVDEKLQRVEQMLHNEVLKGAKKSQQQQQQSRLNKSQTGLKSFIKNSVFDKNSVKYNFSVPKKLSPSNSRIRQEMLTAMTGLNSSSSTAIRGSNFPDTKRTNPSAAVIANALLAARHVNLFNY